MKELFVTIVFTFVCLENVQSGEYVKADGRTYYISYPLTKNWYQALRFCRRNGMYLLDIRTEDENVRVLSLVERFRKNHNISTPLVYWTSGSDLGSEGSYYWMTTGEELLYTYWSKGSPDNYRSANNETENCLVIQGSWNNMWNDGVCSMSTSFICRDVYDVAILKPSKCTTLFDEL